MSGFTHLAGQYPGTGTNDAANAGNIGEVAVSEVLAGAAVSIPSATATNITSISLTAGQWLVYGNVTSLPAGGTVQQRLVAWTSTASGTIPTVPNKGAYVDHLVTLAAGNGMTVPVGVQILNLNATTTVYLEAYIIFTTSTMQAHCYLGATRLR